MTDKNAAGDEQEVVSDEELESVSGGTAITDGEITIKLPEPPSWDKLIRSGDLL